MIQQLTVVATTFVHLRSASGLAPECYRSPALVRPKLEQQREMGTIERD